MATWPTSLGNPQFSGYDLETTDPTVRTDMEGGPARVRRRYTSAPDTVSLKFIFDTAQMATFRAFWDYDMANGSAWVYMPVKTGYVAGLESRECRPINGIFKSVPVSATHWLVEFQVEVRRGVYVWYDTINAMKLPSLELDFAGTQSLNSALTSSVQPVASVEFSRASVATYIGSDGLIKTANVNEARFDFEPVTRVCKGLLIEEARTNLLKYSEQFDVWGKNRCTISADQTAAPNGTAAADTLVEDTSAAASHYVAQSVSVTAGKTYTLSFYAKKKERSWVAAFIVDGGFGSPGAFFDLTNGVLGDQIGATGTIKYFGSGWYRCSITGNATVSELATFRIFVCAANSTTASTGDGTSGLYLWGAQLEAGSFPTSYIPTTSAQATRTADVAQMTETNFSSWYRQEEGTFALAVSYNSIVSYSTAFSADSGSSTGAIRVIGWNNGTDRSYVTVGGVASLSTARENTLGKHSYALAYKTDDFASAKNGVDLVADSLGTLPTPAGLRIGSTAGTYFLNGHIARLTYYPKRLANAELQGLSA